MDARVKVYRHFTRILMALEQQRIAHLLFTTISDAMVVLGIEPTVPRRNDAQRRDRIASFFRVVTRDARRCTDAFDNGIHQGASWVTVEEYYAAVCVGQMAQRAADIGKRTPCAQLSAVTEMVMPGARRTRVIYDMVRTFRAAGGIGFRAPWDKDRASLLFAGILAAGGDAAAQAGAAAQAAAEAAAQAAAAHAAAAAAAAAQAAAAHAAAAAAAAAQAAQAAAAAAAAAAEAAAEEAARAAAEAEAADMAEATRRRNPPRPVTASALGARDRHSFHAIDHLPLNVLLHPWLRLRRDVAPKHCASWQRLQVDVEEMISAAEQSGVEDEINTAYRWFLAIHNIFLRVDGKNRGRGRSTADTVAARFEAWENGEYVKLIAWYERAAHCSKSRAFRPLDAQQRIAKALKLIGDGQLGRARRLLESLGTASLDDPHIAAQMRRKIRTEREGRLPGTLNDGGVPFVRVTVKLLEAYRKLRPNAGTGMDNCRNEYLKALTVVQTDAKAMRSIPAHEAIAERFLNAEFPPWVYAAMAAKKALAIIKSRGQGGQGPDVRPILMGEVRGRAWMARAVADIAPAMGEHFSPEQVAIGVRSGLEKMWFSIVLQMLYRPRSVVVKFDFKNAYPTMHKAAVLDSLLATPCTRNLGPVFWATESPDADVPGLALKQGDGLPTGGPISSTGFCACINPDVRESRATMVRDGGIMVFDMDDGYGQGDVDKVIPEAYALAERLKERCGISLNTDKCEVYASDPVVVREYLAAHPRYAEVFRLGKLEGVDEEAAAGAGFGVMVGGIPFGDDAYVESKLAKKMDTICEGTDTLVNALRGVSHSALVPLLMYCVQPRPNYEMRMLDPAILRPTLERFDAHLLKAMGIATGINFVGPQQEYVRRRLRLPKRKYGGGVREQAEVANAAYLAALISALPAMANKTVFVQGEAEVTRGFNDAAGVWLLGQGACAEGNEENRWSFFIEHSDLGRRFRDLWQGLQMEVALEGEQAPESGVLAEPVVSAGLQEGEEVHKMQHNLTLQRELRAFDIMDAEIMALATGESRRVQWLSMNKFSTAFVGVLPTNVHTVISNEQLEVMFEMYYDQPFKAGSAWVGTRFGNHRQYVLDEQGHALCSSAGKFLHNRRHDEMKFLLWELMRKAGILVECEVFNLFAMWVRQDLPRGTRQICIPDFMYTNSTTRVLADLKCINVCVTRYPAARMHGRCGAVAHRQQGITAEYRRKMVTGDRTHNGTPVGEVGPLERALAGFGRVEGWIFGAYAEASEDVVELVREIARGWANLHWRDMGARSATEAAPTLGNVAIRWLGVGGGRAHAALKLARLRNVVGGDARQANNRRRDSERAYRFRRAAYYAYNSPEAWS